MVIQQMQIQSDLLLIPLYRNETIQRVILVSFRPVMLAPQHWELRVRTKFLT